MIGRIVRRARRRLWPFVARLRYRRLAARARALLRRLRAQADVDSSRRAATGCRRVQRESRSRRCRPDGAKRADLELALEVIAGPDDASRHCLSPRLAPSAPRGAEGFSRPCHRPSSADADCRPVRSALDRLSQRLVKAAPRWRSQSPLLPDLAQSARIFMRLLMAALSERWPPEIYAQAQSRGRHGQGRRRQPRRRTHPRRGLSYRDWAEADMARIKLQRQWSECFANGTSCSVRRCRRPPFPTIIQRRYRSAASISTAKKNRFSINWSGPNRDHAGTSGDRGTHRLVGNGSADRCPDHRPLSGRSHDDRLCLTHGAGVRRVHTASRLRRLKRVGLAQTANRIAQLFAHPDAECPTTMIGTDTVRHQR